MDDREPNHRSYAIAVLIEFFIRLHLARLEVRHDALDHLVEKTMRDGIALNRVAESRPNGILAKPLVQCAVEFHAPQGDALLRLPRCPYRWIVAQIVAMTHECVNRTHGLPAGFL